MRISKTIAKIIFFIGFNVLVVLGMHFMLAQPSVVDVLINISEEEKTDIVILGESDGEAGLDPYIIGEELGGSGVNAARRLVPVQNMYYMLKALNSDNQVKTVILDIDPSYWVGEYDAARGTDANIFFQDTGLIGIEYLFNEALDSNFTDYLFDYSFTGSNISRIPKVLKSKLTSDYFNKTDASVANTNEVMGLGKNYQYIGRGYRYGLRQDDDPFETYDETTWDMNEVSAKALEGYARLRDYCEEHDIKLICMISACPPYRKTHENLDAVHDYFDKLCAENGVEFYDMNYVKSEYLKITDDGFVDIQGHMMGKTSEAQSIILTDIIKSPDREKYFYSSYEEVLAGIEN